MNILIEQVRTAGFESGKAGATARDNPYIVGTSAREEWMKGWTDAKAEDWFPAPRQLKIGRFFVGFDRKVKFP